MAKWRELTEDLAFVEAEPEMLAETEPNDPYGDNVVFRARFYEAWGDILSLDFRPDAKRRYGEALRLYQLFASWSTSGGEGTARMMDVNRVSAKMKGLFGY